MKNDDLEGLKVIREYHSGAAERLNSYAEDDGLRHSDVEHYRKRAKVHERFVATLDSILGVTLRCPTHQRTECLICDWPPRQRISMASGSKIEFDRGSPLKGFDFIVHPDNDTALDAAVRDAVTSGTGSYAITGVDGEISIHHIELKIKD